ncbi:MAG TPA: hypothetical protein VGD13_09120 [Xanthobacteraceae bacterium]
MVSRNGEDVTATEARQGNRDRPVLLVLLASLGLAFVLFGLLLYFGVLKFPY